MFLLLLLLPLLLLLIQTADIVPAPADAAPALAHACVSDENRAGRSLGKGDPKCSLNICTVLGASERARST